MTYHPKVIEAVNTSITDVLGEQTFNEETPFNGDSLDRFGVAMWIEETLNIDLDDETPEKWQTVGDIYRDVNNLFVLPLHVGCLVRLRNGEEVSLKLSTVDGSKYRWLSASHDDGRAWADNGRYCDEGIVEHPFDILEIVE